MKSHLFNVHDIVLIMTMSQCILLAALQSLMPTQNRVAHHLLTCFFLLTLANVAGTLLLWNEALQNLDVLRRQYILPVVLSVSSLLKGPVLYFYLRSICEPSFELNRRRVLHFIPLLVALVLMIIFDIRGIDLVGALEARKGVVVLGLWTSYKLLPVIYVAVCAYTVRHVSAKLMNHYSDGDIGAEWSRILVVGYLIHWSWSLMTHVIGNNPGITVRLSDTLGIVDNYLAFLMVNLLFVYSLLYARRVMVATLLEDKLEEEDGKKAPPNAEPSDTAIEKVKAGIYVEKLYLERNINIEQFSRRIGLTTRDTSHAINTHFNSNFFEFINKFRVEEAQHLLASAEHKDDTILEILYRSGFNSTSAFHRFFKRVSGMSPSEYRKAKLNS